MHDPNVQPGNSQARSLSLPHDIDIDGLLEDDNVDVLLQRVVFVTLQRSNYAAPIPSAIMQHYAAPIMQHRSHSTPNENPPTASDGSAPGSLTASTSASTSGLLQYEDPAVSLNQDGPTLSNLTDPSPGTTDRSQRGSDAGAKPATLSSASNLNQAADRSHAKSDWTDDFESRISNPGYVEHVMQLLRRASPNLRAKFVKAYEISTTHPGPTLAANVMRASWGYSMRLPTAPEEKMAEFDNIIRCRSMLLSPKEIIALLHVTITKEITGERTDCVHDIHYGTLHVFPCK